MRFLPSHCDGGGFFIAVLDKVKEFRLVKKAAGENVKCSESNHDDNSSDSSDSNNNVCKDDTFAE